MQISRTVPLLILLIFYGCVSPHPEIVVTKATDINPNPKKIFIVSDLDQSRLGPSSDVFFGKLAQIMQSCGTETEKFIVGPLAIDSDAQLQAVAEFSPDLIMDIKFAWRVSEADYYNAKYKVVLFDVRQKKTVWIADVFQRKSELRDVAETIAEDITNNMKKDGVFRSCAQIKSN